jgi:hypothetical protein
MSRKVLHRLSPTLARLCATCALPYRFIVAVTSDVGLQRSHRSNHKSVRLPAAFDDAI